MLEPLPDTITVKVTQDDINNGEALECETCPIALAFIRAYSKLDDYGVSCEVLNSQIRAFNRRNLKYYILPDEAQTFIFDFDVGHPVKPFEFSANAKDPNA